MYVKVRNINIDWRRVAAAAAAVLSAERVVGTEVVAVAAGHPAKQAVVADAAKPEVVAAATADTVRIAEGRHRWKTAAEVAGIVPAAVPLRPNVAVAAVPSSSRRLTAPEKSARA